jgi:hypothetical protein
MIQGFNDVYTQEQCHETDQIHLLDNHPDLGSGLQ